MLVITFNCLASNSLIFCEGRYVDFFFVFLKQIFSCAFASFVWQSKQKKIFRLGKEFYMITLTDYNPNYIRITTHACLSVYGCIFVYMGKSTESLTFFMPGCLHMQKEIKAYTPSMWAYSWFTLMTCIKYKRW